MHYFCFFFFSYSLISGGGWKNKIVLNNLLELLALSELQSTVLVPWVEIAETEVSSMHQLIDVFFDVRVHTN